MTTKHTRGPWHTGDGNGEGSIFCDEGRMRIEGGGTTLYPICKVITGWDTGEDDANARLIAAAPELLEALVGILEDAGYTLGEALPSLRELKVNRTRLDKARAAIAKAEGKA